MPQRTIQYLYDPLSMALGLRTAPTTCSAYTKALHNLLVISSPPATSCEMIQKISTATLACQEVFQDGVSG